MSTHRLPVYCTPINGLREDPDTTYSKFFVPNVREMVNLNGDFSWAPDLKEFRFPSRNPWETFKDNAVLWAIFESPTSCYVEISEDEDTGRTIFYRDQQDCIIWSVDLRTGKVYSDADGENPIADDIEEFWLRQYIEAKLWYHLVQYNKNLEDAPELLQKYAQFYQLFRKKFHPQKPPLCNGVAEWP